MDRKLGGLATALLLAGCAQAPLMKQTQSGKAEATFMGVSIDEMRNELVLACTKDGSEVKTDTYSVVCGKQDNSGKALLAQAMLGNRFSETPWQKLRFTFAGVPGGVFVTADMWMEMSKGFGEVERIPNTNVADRNMLQSALDTAAENAKRRKVNGMTQPQPVPEQ